MKRVYCPNCETEFTTSSSRTRYCSIRCAKLHHYRTTAPDPKGVLLAKREVDEETGCWNWTGSFRGPPGGLWYGRVQWRGQAWQVHRLSYSAFKGDVPAGLFVCHRCDNPRCFNPEHLFLGTPQDNHVDMQQKGRIARGARHGMTRRAKLDEEAVRAIRASTERGVDLARRYGVTASTITEIRKGTSRRHVQ